MKPIINYFKDTYQKLKEADLFDFRSVLEIIFSLVVFIMIITGAYLLIQWIGIDQIRGFVKDSGPLAPVSYILVQALSMVLAPMSATSVMVLAGTLFGPGLSFVYAYIGSMLGFSLNFWIARVFGRNLLAKIGGKDDLQKIDKLIKILHPNSIYILPVLLFFMIDFISYLAGFTKVKFKIYILIVAIVNIFLALATVTAGNVLFL
jgi:uncharacterized membrane protein YdjX (TVP38/TMEM64 family)